MLTSQKILMVISFALSLSLNSRAQDNPFLATELIKPGLSKLTVPQLNPFSSKIQSNAGAIKIEVPLLLARQALVNSLVSAPGAAVLPVPAPKLVAQQTVTPSSDTCTLNLKGVEPTLNRPAIGGSLLVNFSISGAGACKKSAIAEDDWVSIVNLNETHIQLLLEPNKDVLSRETKITLVAGERGDQATFTIKQAGVESK